LKRIIIPSSAFIRASKHYLKKHPDDAKDISETIDILAYDAFDIRLRTHILHGKFKGCYACDAGYNLRIIFEFIDYSDKKTKIKINAIVLHTIGTHEEVY
jgi:mRNA-degrading endonuclease YafQ of YafQ-DinJ toxin-antitoxin module